MYKRLIPLLIIVLSYTSFAQGRDEMKERIKTQKIAFITDRLELTSKEAEKFWPIYNSIDTKKEALRKQSASKRKLKKPEELTESEAKTLLNEMLAIEDQRHQLHRELVTKLDNVISSKKILALMRAEREFDRKIIQKFKEFRHKRREKNRP